MIQASIEKMPDKVLDILAEELRLPYYDPSYTTSVKRGLVRGGLQYWATAGTPESLTKILTNIFGDAEIEEWFEYGGEPGRFRIVAKNPSLAEETLLQFMNILNKVKRASAKLDGISIVLDGELNLSAGVAYHETGFERYAIGAVAPQ